MHQIVIIFGGMFVLNDPFCDNRLIIDKKSIRIRKFIIIRLKSTYSKVKERLKNEFCKTDTVKPNNSKIMSVKKMISSFSFSSLLIKYIVTTTINKKYTHVNEIM